MKSRNAYVLGIDLGGTQVRVALSSLGSAAGVIGAGALAWRKNT